eukprot:COSAG03_NODE_2145_length_3076_cov_133.616392_1_plen_74_part_00
MLTTLYNYAVLQMLDSNDGCWHLTCVATNHRIVTDGGEVMRGQIYFCRRCRTIVSSGDDVYGKCSHCNLKMNE